MKKLYFAILFIALTGMLHSQDSEPEAFYFRMSGTMLATKFDIEDFKQEKSKNNLYFL